MRKNLGAIPGLFPMPVTIVAAYDEAGVVNPMNAAWAMISDMDQITLFLSEGHKTTKNIQITQAFSVSIADVAHMDVADFYGIASGNTMPDKFAHTGYHAEKSAFVNAPVITEFPVTMECSLLEIVKTEHLYAIVGKIVNVSADESVLAENDKIDPKKLNALLFDQFQSGYYTIGEQVGKAWNAGKKWMP